MSPLPILIDTDPGVDDAVAILLALASPELTVRAILPVAGNVPIETTQKNARKICELAGRRDIKIHAGCTRPLLRDQILGKYSGQGGLGAETLPEPTMALADGHAVDVLIRDLGAAARGEAPRITLATLGPLTNVALALAHSPSIAAGVERLVMMGGAFGGGGNRTAAAEFNVLADPHAAQIVMDSGIPIVMAPLDVTHQALATPQRLQAIQATGGRIAQTVFRLLTFYDRNDPKRFGGPGGPVHDAMVIAYLLWPELFTTRHAYVQVEHMSALTYGQTLADWWGTGGKPANVEVLWTLDAERFFARLTERIARLG
jgi:purine nucleosidase